MSSSIIDLIDKSDFVLKQVLRCWCKTEAVKWERMRWDHEILYLNALNVIWDCGDEDKDDEECSRHGQTSRFQSHFPSRSLLRPWHLYRSVGPHSFRLSLSPCFNFLRPSPSFHELKNTTNFYGSHQKLQALNSHSPHEHDISKLQGRNIKKKQSLFLIKRYCFPVLEMLLHPSVDCWKTGAEWLLAKVWIQQCISNQH